LNNYEAEKERIKVELKHKKYSDALIKKTVGTGNKYNVQFNDEALNSIEVLNTTMWFIDISVLEEDCWLFQ